MSKEDSRQTAREWRRDVRKAARRGGYRVVSPRGSYLGARGTPGGTPARRAARSAWN
jgi:hypothetical protein